MKSIEQQNTKENLKERQTLEFGPDVDVTCVKSMTNSSCE